MLSPDRLAARLLWSLDAIAIAALLGTEEVDARVLVAPAVALGLRLAGVRIRSQNILLALLVAVITVGAVAIARYKLYPIVAAAHGAILLTSLLWLGPSQARDRVLRLGLVFAAVLISAALTTDLYLLACIVALALLGSLYLAATFLESQADTVPPGFVRGMARLAAGIFALSLLLFPILPRATWRLSDDRFSSVIGFRDTIDLTPAPRETARDTHRLALTITDAPGSATPRDPLDQMPGRLLRGSDLELFDGQLWLPRLQKRLAARSRPRPRPRPAPAAVAGSRAFEVALEPRLNGQPFLPYQSRVVGEPDSAHYLYEAAPRAAMPELSEAPYEVHLRVPAAFQRADLVELGQRVMGAHRAPTEKVAALDAFFRGGFGVTAPATAPGTSTAERLADFLLRARAGHCELFATAAALLLRQQGVPTRLVTGFRVTRPARGGALVVAESDAHAWIEYWDGAAGWRYYDPTPVVLRREDWLEGARSAYWLAFAAWDRWVLNFRKVPPGQARPSEPVASPGAQLRAWLAPSGSLGLVLAGFAALAGLLYARRRKGTESPLPRHLRRLKKEYRRLGRFHADPRWRSTPEYKDWEELYLELRFGRGGAPAVERRWSELVERGERCRQSRARAQTGRTP